MLRLHNRLFNITSVNKILSFLHKICPDYIELKKWLYYFKIDSNLVGAYLGIFKNYERKRIFNDSLKALINNYRAENDKIAMLQSYKGDFISKMQNLDFNSYLVDDVLTKVDRTSMANSLEVRVPLLDHEVVELASKVPSRFKINKHDQKIIFKKTFTKNFPKKILEHKKQGFSVPLSMWFRDSLRDYLHDTILNSQAEVNNFFDPKEIKKIVKNHNIGYRDYSSKIWTILVLEEWLINNNYELDFN